MQHSQSEVLLGNQSSSWADLKKAAGLKKRSNTAENLKFYGMVLNLYNIINSNSPPI